MSTLAELIENNESLSYIRDQGYTVRQIIQYTPNPNLYSVTDFFDAGYTIQEILDTNGFFALIDLYFSGISIQTIVDNNYTIIDLLDSGFNITQIKPYFSLVNFYNSYISQPINNQLINSLDLKITGYTVEELKNVGFTVNQFKTDGFTVNQLYPDFTIQQLNDAGFTVNEFKTGGFTATQLKAAGFTATQLKAAGFTATQLKAAGFTAAELKAEEFTATQLKVAGFTVAELSLGYTIAEIKDGGYTARQMYPTFTAAELKAEGFTVTQLKAAGFTVAELYIDFSFQELYPTFMLSQLYPSFSIQGMIDEGISLLTLLDSGINYDKILLEVPYTEVFSLNYDISSIYDAFVSMKSVTVEELFNIASEYGISENSALLKMLSNGINLLEIYQYGNYSIEDIRPLYTTAEQKLNGYKIADMILAGYSVSELYPSAGYTLREYYLGGVEGVELYSLGATANELIAAGYETYCLNTGTRILCVNRDGEEYEKVVEELKVGDVVKSYKHGNRKIQNICCGELINDASKIRWSMYKMKESGLIMTGGHSIMVDKLSEEEYKRTISEWEIQEIDEKVLLMAGYSSKFEQIQGNEKFSHYNFNLENDGDENKRYGVYANGILVETPSEKIIKGFKNEK